MTDPGATFSRLDPGWQTAFREAWAAFADGCYPVGAALVDDTGNALAEGRNRIHSDEGEGVSGTLLGHAEIDALRTLAVHQRHDQVTLYTTLEPCLFCMGAVILSRVGTVRFAGSDPYGGASHVPRDLNAQTARYELRICGPLPGPFGLLGAALPLAHLKLTDTWTRVLDHMRDTDRDLLERAEALAELPSFRSPGSATLPEALAEAWPILVVGNG